MSFPEGQVISTKEGSDVHTFQGRKLLVGNFVKAPTDRNIIIRIVRNSPLPIQFAIQAREECENCYKNQLKYLSNV